MDFKIFFVFTIYFSIQVLCKVQVKPAQTPELIEAHKQTGEFGTLVTFDVMEDYINDGYSEVPKCYKGVQPRYEAFTQKLAEDLSKAVTDLEKPIKPKPLIPRQKMQASLKKMIEFLKQCPPQIGKLLDQNEKDKAAENVKLFRIKFEYHFVVYTAEMNKLKKAGLTNIVTKANQKVQETKEKAEKESKNIILDFEKCMGVKPSKSNKYDPKKFWTSYLG